MPKRAWLVVQAMQAQHGETCATVKASFTMQLVPAPGAGPSESAMDNGSFRCELVGTSASGNQVRVKVAGQGDPGNRATTIMVCEAAMALVRDAQRLPGGAKGGVLTPACALGEVLVERLQDAGLTLEG